MKPTNIIKVILLLVLATTITSAKQQGVKYRFIRKGQTKYGEILFNIDSCFVRKGQLKIGKILYRLE